MLYVYISKKKRRKKGFPVFYYTFIMQQPFCLQILTTISFITLLILPIIALCKPRSSAAKIFQNYFNAYDRPAKQFSDEIGYCLVLTFLLLLFY